MCADTKNLGIVQSVIRNIPRIIDSKNESSMTPALIATSNGNEEIFYVLKGLNANLEISDVNGNTVYHYICRTGICPGMMINNKKNRFGFTPYDYCIVSPKIYYFQERE